MANCLKSPYREIIEYYIQNGTIHGLSSFSHSKKFIFQAFWLLVIFASSIICFMGIISTIFEYFQYDTITNIQEVLNLPQVFPTVTICNQNKNITIEEMLLVCLFNIEKCTFKDFYKVTVMNNVFGRIPCYSFNIGKDFYGNPKKLEVLHGPDLLVLDMYTGHSKNDFYSSGLLVAVHNNTNLPSIYSFFAVPTGKRLSFKIHMILISNLFYY